MIGSFDEIKYFKDHFQYYQAKPIKTVRDLRVQEKNTLQLRRLEFLKLQIRIRCMDKILNESRVME